MDQSADGPPPALRTALVELLTERNYAELTIDMIAERAEVDREILYRWPSKAELAVGVYLTYIRELFDPDTGQVRDDLLNFAHQVLTLLSGPASGLIHAVITELYGQQELREAWAEVNTIVVGLMTTMLRRGIRRGQVRQDAPINLVTELARGWWTSRFSAGRSLHDADAMLLVDSALMPILRPRPNRAGRS